MESVRLPNNAELERWCRAKILAALDRWQDEEISRRLATEKRRTKRKNRPRLRPAPIMRQPRRTRARRPDFGDLHAGTMSTRFYDTDLTDAAWAWVAPV